MVFAKDQGEGLASLVKEIDKVVADNKSKKMAAFINIIGDDRDELEEQAAKFGKPFENVPVVVPVEYELGPKNFNVNPEAGVTVMIYKGTTIAANHAVPAGKLDKKTIEKIIKDTEKILN